MASLSPKINNCELVCGLIKLENASFPAPIKQYSRSTVIKYTKLPNNVSDITVSWPRQRNSRTRRFMTLEDELVKTARTTKSDITFHNKMTSDILKRKVVTITEDDENDLHPRFSRESKKSNSVKTSNRSVAANFKEEKLFSSRNTSRLSMSPKYANETKARMKLNNNRTTKETSNLKPVNTRKSYNVSNEQIVPKKSENIHNDASRNFKKTNKSIVRRNIITSEDEKELSSIKTKLLKNGRSCISPKKLLEKSQTDSCSPQVINNKVSFLKEIQAKNKPVTIIHVPLEEKYQKNDKSQNDTTKINEIKNYRNINIGTDPPPTTVDDATNMDDYDIRGIEKYLKSTHIQTEITKDTFDSLEIPNVTLTKEKNNSKDEKNRLGDKSPLSIKIQPVGMPSDNNDEIGTSFIISRATLTYTTQQKINFKMVESKDNILQSQSPSPLSYPLNIVSVFKNKIKKKNCKDEAITKINKNETEISSTKCFNELKSFNCSYAFDNTKLIKPSDIIRTISVDSDYLQSDYICDQFQRELNFIDSFFESLQYLENSSFSSKCFTNEKVDDLVCRPSLLKNVFKEKNSHCDIFTKLDNDCDDTNTMASKGVCLLNTLIRDEQRRAKNLLFVLKMREDALKEFATSQILWLENRKKHDKTDVSVLKKKQRGALLKLQHECGEMQRIRKALLTLSEKRKVALMKTKKCLELKLKNNVDVDQIVLDKKKLKKSMCADRNTVPLKCFDLSSSGCEESSSSKHNSGTLFGEEIQNSLRKRVKSAEKSIQTGDSVVGSTLDQSTDTAAENFVVVDGSYLNILFNNLSLPEIFSGGKQYEVNEDALKNIVNSSNTHNNNLSKGDIIEKLINQNKSRDSDMSSSPSTARSLVDEFNNYYKEFEGDKSPIVSSESEKTSPSVVYELKDTAVQVSQYFEQIDNRVYQSTSTMTSDSDISETANNDIYNMEKSCMCEALDLARSLVSEDVPVMSQTGPLPVPVGASAQTEISGTNVTVWPLTKSISTSTVSDDNSEGIQSVCQNIPSLTSVSSPVHYEAEELRRQQLAIEREIKALEQQQSQLLVVREIPDKPPPPYTPPADTRVLKSPKLFIDYETEEKIRNIMITETNVDLDPYETFDLFLKDFCDEALERQKSEHSEKPWDACNLLPQKQQCDTEKLVQITKTELSDILSGVTPTVVSGVGARRSDHIDDILFAEWRRCEPEWTSLHTDEAIVKNQIFDCIFQKILTETVDEYKKIKSDTNTSDT